MASFLTEHRFRNQTTGRCLAVLVITDEQRRVLVEHALDCNWSDGPDGQATEARFADVIADLAWDRTVVDRDSFASFLWQRVSLALEAGPSRKAHWAWSAAVQVLDQLDEDLEHIFTGRPTDLTLEAERTERR